MRTKYKVRLLQDEIYEVVKTVDFENVYECEDYDGDTEKTVYQGSLSDCNAWLQLNDRGYI